MNIAGLSSKVFPTHTKRVQGHYQDPTPVKMPDVPADATIDELANSVEHDWEERMQNPRCQVGILCERGWRPKDTSDPVLEIADSIMDAGGVPKLLYIGDGTSEEQMADLDALAIPGGRDVDPISYGQERGPGMADSKPDLAFDQFEIECIQEAFEKGLPMLGHCRGEQIMNVAGGGTLTQDIPTTFETPEGWGSKYGTPINHRPEEVRTDDSKRVDPVHLIVTADGSRIQQMTGDALESVNSIHHQAIDEISPILEPVAWALDGLIEGVERKGMPWQAAYQFHPESLRQTDSAYQKMYDQLVDDGAAYKNGELPIPDSGPLPWQQ